MKRKELLEKIKEEMPKTLKEKEKAAFIMMKIAEDRAFSEHYYWGDALVAKKIYSRATNPRDVEPENKRKLICTTASRLFEYIATKLELDVLYMGEEGLPVKGLPSWLKDGEHVYPIVRLSDGNLIKCDIQRDLHNIQTGCHWKFFGTRELVEYGILSVITPKELEEIMQRIGYLNTREIYTDDFCRKQVSEMNKPKTVTEIVREVFENEMLNKEVEHTSIVETYKFYGKVMNIYLAEEYRNYSVFRKTLQLTRYLDSFFMFPCKLKKDGKIRYTVCAYTYEQDDIGTIYLLSRTTRRMLQVSLQELASYEEQGLRFPNQGTKFLKRELRDLRGKKETQNISRVIRIDLEEFLDESADERE